jgi:hypothetical protein
MEAMRNRKRKFSQKKQKQKTLVSALVVNQIKDRVRIVHAVVWEVETQYVCCGETDAEDLDIWALESPSAGA